MKEGTGISKLAQVIRDIGYNDYDRFELATLTSLVPTRIKADGMLIELDADDIVMAEHLTDHTRTVKINGGADASMFVKSPLRVGDRLIITSANGGQTYVVLDKAIMV